MSAPGRVCLPLAVVTLACAFTTSVQADSPPKPTIDSGRLLRELEQRPLEAPELRELPPTHPVAPGALPEEAAEVQVLPVKYRVRGATVFTEAEIDAALAPYTGKLMGVDGLRGAVEALTRLYQDNGYFLSLVYMPSQALVGEGQPTEVEMGVLEARYGNVLLFNESRARHSVILRNLGVGLGDFVKREPLEHGLLLISDLPGVSIAGSDFRPGAKEGETEYLLALTSGPAIQGLFALDNYGNRSTGRNRGTLQIQWQSPTGFADEFSLTLNDSRRGSKTGSIAYRVPVGPRGLMLGVTANKVEYALGGEFASSEIFGSARTRALEATYSIVRSIQSNLKLRVAAEQKYTSDHILFASQDKYSRSTVIGLSGDTLDPLVSGNFGSWSGAATFGELFMQSELAKLIDDGRHEGTFTRFNFEALLGRSLESLRNGLGFQFALRGQLARDNLNSAEKMSIVGPSGVRAYGNGEPQSSGDIGWQASLELRQRVNFGERFAGMSSAFYDLGAVTIDARPPNPPGDRRMLRGLGLGLYLSAPGNLFVNSSIARPLGAGSRDPDQGAKGSRAWVVMGARF